MMSEPSRWDVSVNYMSKDDGLYELRQEILDRFHSSITQGVIDQRLFLKGIEELIEAKIDAALSKAGKTA